LTPARTRRTKIVCTLGPATTDPDVIEQLAWAGMDAARLNFSHGSHEDHLARIDSVRRTQALVGRPLALIADLQGPKIRLGRLPEPRQVSPGELVVLAAEGKAGPGELEVTFDGLADVVPGGAVILVDDGRVRLRATSVRDGRVETRVEVGGLLSSSKGVNLPGTPLPIASLTPKDREDLQFALAHGVDYVALSFVRAASDVRELRELIAEAGSDARIIAKIEKAEAVADLASIIAEADALMVARGDLGVEIGVADVPLIQKRIISAARAAGRLVITATQMLESMIREPEPTRAEASDVANAVLDGTSAVMLSGETAMGAYPLEAVATMNRIARAVEPALGEYEPASRRGAGTPAILSRAVCEIAEQLEAAAIAVPTQSGQTARQVSTFRPRQPIVAASTSERVLQQLALEWAVIPLVIEPASTTEDLWDLTVAAIRRRGLAEPGDQIVVTGGTMLNTPGTTDHIVVRTAT
jgi:pyruvate kinase